MSWAKPSGWLTGNGISTTSVFYSVLTSTHAFKNPWPQQKHQYKAGWTTIIWMIVMSWCLPGVRTAGLLPRGMKREVCSSFSWSPVSQIKHQLSVICCVGCWMLCFRSYWRNKASWILSAVCWASGSSWGREQEITSVSGSTVSKAAHRPYLALKLKNCFCTHIL